MNNGHEDGKVIIFKKDERIFWLRGPLCNQKGCPIIYWVNGKMYAKVNVLVHKMRKLPSKPFSKQTETLWLIEVMFACAMNQRVRESDFIDQLRSIYIPDYRVFQTYKSRSRWKLQDKYVLFIKCNN